MFASVVNKDAGSLNLRCQKVLFDIETCQPTGWGNFDDNVAKEAPAWFQVNARTYEQNSFPSVQVSASASQRMVNDVEIIDASPYFGTADGPGSPLSQLRSLAGQKISIVFGSPNEGPRAFHPLGCNELDFEKVSSGVFIAGLCGMPDGVARVEFNIGPQGRRNLMALKAAIDRETASGKQAMLENYLIITPIFVVLFLLISGSVWIIRRVISYVAAA